MSSEIATGVLAATCFCLQIGWMFTAWVRASIALGLFNNALRKQRRDIWQSTFRDSTWRTFKLRDGKTLTKLLSEMALQPEPLATSAKRCIETNAGFKKFVWMMPVGFAAFVGSTFVVSYLFS